MTIPDERRNAQLGSLARHALEPLLQRYNEDILEQLITMVYAASPTPIERVWSTLGRLAAGRELIQRCRSAEAGLTRMEK